MNTEEVLRFFENEGLLIRTVSTKNIYLEFQNLDVVDMDEALRRQAEATSEMDKNYYGPKRNWSICQAMVKPHFYMMDKEEGLTREVALLAVPSLVGWDRYLRISPIDGSTSHNLYSTDHLLAPEVAEKSYLKVLGEIASADSNCEINTLGFDMRSFAGIMFKSRQRTWEKAKGEIIAQLRKIPLLQGMSFTVFTYDTPEDKPVLKPLEICTISVR